jgi:hypothetical protein
MAPTPNALNYKPSFNVGKSKGGVRPTQLQQFTPEQMNLFQSLFSHLGPDSFLSKLAGGDEETFNQIEAPALQQFSGIQGNIASRFSGMGSGARKSSGFQNTQNQAASDFAQQLQSQRTGLQSQAIKDLLGMSNELLGQRPYDTGLQQKPASFWEQVFGGLFKGGTQVASGYATGYGMRPRQ